MTRQAEELRRWQAIDNIASQINYWSGNEIKAEDLTEEDWNDIIKLAEATVTAWELIQTRFLESENE